MSTCESQTGRINEYGVENRNVRSNANAKSHLPDVIEISMWDSFEFFKLSHFIEHLMQVELRAQEVQSSVAVRLSGTEEKDRENRERLRVYILIG